MNRKILMGIISIFSVTILVGGVTFAVFTSQATNSGNTFGAGTLVLGVNGTAIFSGLPVMKPGDNSPVQSITLTNSGTLPIGSVGVASLNITGTSDSNLAGKVQLTIWNDTDNDNEFDGGESLFANHIALDSSSWTGLSFTGITIPVSSSQTLKSYLTFDSTAGDDLQGDTLGFNIIFQGNQ